MGRPNWTRTLAYSTAISSTFWAPPTCSAARATAARSSILETAAQPSPSVPTSRAGVSSKRSRACLRVWSMVDSGLGCEARGTLVDREHRHAGRGPGRDQHQVGGVAVEDVQLLAR